MKKTAILALILTNCAEEGPHVPRGERDRVTCETYCDDAGGYLLEIRSDIGLAGPTCICTFDLADPE